MQTLLVDNRTYTNIVNYMPNADQLSRLSELFAVFGDPTRLKIISALSLSELCVTDLSYILNINQTTISHQLKFLRMLNIVTTKRQGKVVFYSISDGNILNILSCGAEAIA